MYAILYIINMSIQILELRQKDALNVQANGVYENVLNGEVLQINEGDQISIKNVFLDTTEENQFSFPNDVNLQIGYGMYIVDWYGDANKTDYQDSDGNTTTPQYLTGDMYIPYQDLSGIPLNPALFDFIQGVQYLAQPNNYNEGENVTFTYFYKDIQGVSRTIHKTYPVSNFNNNRSTNFPINDTSFQLVVQKGSFNLNIGTPQSESGNFDAWDAAGLAYDPINNIYPMSTIFGNTPSVTVQQPYEFTANIVFPAGVYSPQELSQRLSEVMTNNALSNATSVVGNPFLKTLGAFDVGNPEPNYNGPSPAPNISDQVYFYNQSLTSRFGMDQTQKGNKTWIGASQIDFNYDQVSKFQLLFSHVPIYDDDSATNISIRYLRKGSSYPNMGHRRGNIYSVGKHSGIYLTSLESFDSKTGKRTKFWENLGFSLGNVCVQKQSIGQKTLFGSQSFWYTVNLVDGLTTCNAFVGTDTIVIKKKDLWFLEPTVPNDDNVGITATSEATIPIDAELSVPQIQTPFSHYLIELDLGLRNTYIDSSTTYKLIASVVSRYYSYGSYTSDSGEGSIVYTHKGNPVYFRSARVRIMNSDKQPDGDLGDDNTIIVQLIKNSL
jgi:hypothetical protein